MKHLGRLHPADAAWLLFVAVCAFLLAIVSRTAAWMLAVGLFAVDALVLGPAHHCEICYRGYAYWGSRRYRLINASGQRRWIVTRRCWQHRHHPGDVT